MWRAAGFTRLASDDDAARDLRELSADEFLGVLEASGALQGQDELLQKLRDLAARGIHPLDVLSTGTDAPEEEAVLEPVLESFNLEGIARYIDAHRCRNVVVMSGAGISTSAGIPDFRSPGTGLYDNLQRYKLSRPQQIFELDFFREQPGAFYELCRELWPGSYDPTPAHYFIKLLSAKGILRRCYTQNIDSLEPLAGLPKEQLVAAHGNFDEAHVIDTEPEVLVDIEEAKEAIMAGEKGWRALNRSKGGLVKPKIVFFGESLPARFYELVQEDFSSCDLLIVLGTSLVVEPFAGLISRVPPATPRLLVNREPAGTFDRLHHGFRFQLEGQNNWRDVWHNGSCDLGCQQLAAALGWKHDLDSLIASKGIAGVDPAPWA
eukprot:TRINITY_DN43367_c0_g1_i1.p1 TRINITY_DN43367_c0_g1~~TRINITY_DN43367_c0_g1_i1.p1  ORF type:complete len:421 (-),score=53.99 TRINITY_DN43367_c0_g1_i1:153-1286(-)